MAGSNSSDLQEGAPGVRVRCLLLEWSHHSLRPRQKKTRAPGGRGAPSPRLAIVVARNAENCSVESDTLYPEAFSSCWYACSSSLERTVSASS